MNFEYLNTLLRADLMDQGILSIAAVACVLAACAIWVDGLRPVLSLACLAWYAAMAPGYAGLLVAAGALTLAGLLRPTSNGVVSAICTCAAAASLAVIVTSNANQLGISPWQSSVVLAICCLCLGVGFQRSADFGIILSMGFVGIASVTANSILWMGFAVTAVMMTMILTSRLKGGTAG